MTIIRNGARRRLWCRLWCWAIWPRLAAKARQGPFPPTFAAAIRTTIRATIKSTTGPVTGLVTFILSITACGALTASLLAVAPRSGVAQPPGPDELVLMLEAAPRTLDPVLATGATGVRISHQLIYQTLVSLEDNLRMGPGVAESWEQLSPTRYRFRLRQGLAFHDGSPLSGADVVYTLESLMAPETGSPQGPGLREKIATVRAVDKDRSVEIDLTGPYASILADLVLPIRSRNPQPTGLPDPTLNGSGPFRFVSASPTKIVLARNEAWRDPETGAPAGMAQVVFKVVRDENTRLLKLRKGDIDLAINVIPLDKLRQLARPPLNRRYAVVEAPGLSYQYLGFNLEDPVLQDTRVRRAIALAIDVEALIRFRQKGHSTRATSLLTPTSPYALPDAAPLAYDPQAAAQLLDEAGYPERDGTRFSLTYKTSTDRSAVIQARAVQSNLKDIGIAVEVRSFEWGTFYEDVQQGNFQLFSLRWVGVSDPDFYYELFHSSRLPPTGRNRVRYRNAEMDALLEAGRSSTDPPDRLRLYHAVQSRLLRDLPYLSLWHNNNVAVVSTQLKGFQLHPTGGFQHLPAVQKSVR